MKKKDFAFRVYLKDEKRHIFSENVKLENTEKGFIITEKNPFKIHVVEEIELYTGFKDKSGARIYEGDIIVVSDEDDSFKQSVYYDREYKSFCIGDEELFFWLGDADIECEIVGYKGE